MPSIFTTVVAAALTLASTSLAAPAASPVAACVSSVTTNLILADDESAVKGNNPCVDSAFNFIRTAPSANCQTQWTTCFLDAQNTTAYISGPLGFVGFVPGTNVFTSSPTTAPIAWEYDLYPPNLSTDSYILFYNRSWPTVASLDSSQVVFNTSSAATLLSCTMELAH